MQTDSRVAIGYEEARALGLKTYLTGKPCTRGNVAERLVSNRHCTCADCKAAAVDKERRRRDRDPAEYREKQIVRQRKHRVENRGAVLAAKRRYREKNRDKLLAEKRIYREESKQVIQRYRDANRDSLQEKARRYRAENKDVGRAYRENTRHLRNAWFAERRAVERNRKPVWYGEFDRFVMIEAARLCVERGKATGLDWHVDHQIPLMAKRASGLHCGINMQVIPAFLNVSKLNRMLLAKPDEWLRYLDGQRRMRPAALA